MYLIEYLYLRYFNFADLAMLNIINRFKTGLKLR